MPRRPNIYREPGTGPGGSLSPHDLTDEQVKKKEWNLRTRYGITFADFVRMWEEQEGRCGLCGRAPKQGMTLVIDHDHECCMPKKKRTSGGFRYQDSRACGNCNRGLICYRCNRYLSSFERLAPRATLAKYLGWWDV